nr:hypothetical protein 11 [Legionellales bacterium]
MARDRIEIEVLAKGVKDAQKDIDKLKKSINKTGETTQQAGESMIGTFTAVAAGAFAAFQTIKKGLDLAQEFARFQQGAKAMEAQFGVSANKVIQSLDKVARGTVSNADLIESANRAMALNVTQDVGEMAELLEVARVRGQAMGLDTTQAFNDIVTGIGRGSPLILDNLGIITKGWAEEAKAAGKAMDAQFILNKVLKDGREIMKRTGEVTLTNAERMQQWTAQMENAKLAIGKELLPVFLDASSGFTKFTETLIGKGTGLNAIIRIVRTLVAAVKIVGLQFTTAGRLFAVAFTPAIQLSKAMFQAFEDIRASFGKFLNVFKDFEWSIDGAKKAWATFKEAGSGTFNALKNLGKNFATNTAESIKNQIKLMAKEYKGAFISITDIFSKIDALVEQSNIKRQEGSNKTRQLSEENEKAITKAATAGFTAMGDAMGDFEKGAKDILKDTFMATIKSIATEIRARGIARIAASIFPPNPPGVAAGTGMIAAAGAIQGLGAAAVSRFRRGTDFSPQGPAIVGEVGPELINLPQGARVIPNNEITNNDNRATTNIINVHANNGMELVNDLQSQYGINAFEAG